MLENNIFLFAADAEDAHHNVNVREELELLELVLSKLLFKLRPGLSRKEIIFAINILLRFNFF